MEWTVASGLDGVSRDYGIISTVYPQVSQNDLDSFTHQMTTDSLRNSYAIGCYDNQRAPNYKRAKYLEAVFEGAKKVYIDAVGANDSDHVEWCRQYMDVG